MKQFLIKFGKGFAGFVSRHQFAFLITTTVAIALTSVFVSVYIYVVSGAINIDLSRPGYESVREDTVDEVETRPPFSPAGPMNDEVRQDLIERLSELQNQMKQMNDFGGDVLSDKSLNLQ